MLARLNQYLLGFIVLLLLSQSLAHAYRTGVLSGGALHSNGGAGTGLRELVELQSVGELLIGKPRHSRISLISIYAPGVTSGHLIIRELITPEDSRSIQVTAPAYLTDGLVRTTIYVNKQVNDTSLFVVRDGAWVQLLPHVFSVSDHLKEEVPERRLSAYVTNGIGSFLLADSSENAPAQQPNGNDEYTAQQLLGGGVSRAMQPLIAAALLLLAGWLASYMIHIRSRHDY